MGHHSCDRLVLFDYAVCLRISPFQRLDSVLLFLAVEVARVLMLLAENRLPGVRAGGHLCLGPYLLIYSVDLHLPGVPY